MSFDMPGMVLLGPGRPMPKLYVDEHPEVRTTVLDGTMVRCRGCGREHGLACVAFDDDYVYVKPTFPFPEDDCPVCWYHDVAMNGWPHERAKRRSEPTGKPLGLDPARLP